MQRLILASFLAILAVGCKEKAPEQTPEPPPEQAATNQAEPEQPAAEEEELDGTKWVESETYGVKFRVPDDWEVKQSGENISVTEPNGAVRAMVGGPGFADAPYNIASSGPGRQVGSSYKPFVLARILEEEHRSARAALAPGLEQAVVGRQRWLIVVAQAARIVVVDLAEGRIVAPQLEELVDLFLVLGLVQALEQQTGKAGTVRSGEAECLAFETILRAARGDIQDEEPESPEKHDAQ